MKQIQLSKGQRIVDYITEHQDELKNKVITFEGDEFTYDNGYTIVHRKTNVMPVVRNYTVFDTPTGTTGDALYFTSYNAVDPKNKYIVRVQELSDSKLNLLAKQIVSVESYTDYERQLFTDSNPNASNAITLVNPRARKSYFVGDNQFVVSKKEDVAQFIKNNSSRFVDKSIIIPNEEVEKKWSRRVSLSDSAVLKNDNNIELTVEGINRKQGSVFHDYYVTRAVEHLHISRPIYQLEKKTTGSVKLHTYKAPTM